MLEAAWTQSVGRELERRGQGIPKSGDSERGVWKIG